jgi:protein ImuB
MFCGGTDSLKLFAGFAAQRLTESLPDPFGDGHPLAFRKTLDFAQLFFLEQHAQPLVHRMSLIDSLQKSVLRTMPGDVRLACVFVPLFPLAARLRSEPDLKGEAVVIVEGNGNAARVIAASRKARRAGIEAGMTLPQSRALLPKLTARARDVESERAAEEALLEVADGFSPRVEDGGEGVVFLDIEGIPALARRGESDQRRGVRPRRDQVSRSSTSETTRVAGAGAPRGGQASSRARDDEPLADAPEDANPRASSRAGERLLGQDLIAAVEKAGLPARAGIASSKLAARVAAGLPDSPGVVPAGEEGEFLAPLPLSRLSPQIEIAATLELWGIRSIGEFAKLPPGEVESRLGELGRRLHAAARGIDTRPLEPRLPALSFCEGMDLEWPLVSLEPFLFVGNAALERLTGRLESQGLACRRLELALKLDPDGCDARAISLPSPTREAKTLLTLVRLELEARPPGAPITGFTFTAHPDKPRRAQLSLFGPPALSPDRLAATIARLASLLGADRVGSPRAVDGHRPERFVTSPYEPPPPPEMARCSSSGRGLLAVRVLRPPVELEVIVATPPHPELLPHHPDPLPQGGEGNGLGRLRLLSLKSHPGSTPEIAGAVRVAAGPWSMEEGWWSDAPAARDYWDVELSEGGLYRIYRDRAHNAWFADGVYD